LSKTVEAPTTEKAAVAISTSSTIIQETNVVLDTQINQDSATFQPHVALEAGSGKNQHVQKSKSDACAELQPSQSVVEPKVPSNQDADTKGNSKPVRTSKRQFQHPTSMTEDESLTKLSKTVEAPTTEKAAVAISTSKTQIQHGALRHIIRRPDGEETTRLRNRPDGSQKNGVWVKGNASVGQGEVVDLLRKDFAGEQGFAYIRTANNIEGFVRSEYIHSTTSSENVSKKQKSTDNYIAAMQKPSLVAHASKDTIESIDCSPVQVVPKLELVQSFFYLFTEYNYC
jgi:hypothetical protein